jgi:hypothetical protein
MGPTDLNPRSFATPVVRRASRSVRMARALRAPQSLRGLRGYRYAAGLVEPDAPPSLHVPGGVEAYSTDNWKAPGYGSGVTISTGVRTAPRKVHGATSTL